MRKLLNLFFAIVFPVFVFCQTTNTASRLYAVTAVKPVNYKLSVSPYLPKQVEIKSTPAKTFFGWGDVAAWAFSGLGGAAMGLREAQHADPDVFERPCSETSFFICGKSPISFWGSQQWRRKYNNNDPAQGKKSELFGNFGRDSWHTLDKLQRAGLVVGVTLPLIRQNRPMKKRILNSAISLAFYSLMYSFSYNVRYI